MMNNIDHVGVAVKDIIAAELIYTQLLGMEVSSREYLEEGQLSISFFEKGAASVELIQTQDRSHPIAKFIEKKGEGLHHVAYAVDDIFIEIERLKLKGFTVIGKPQLGAKGKLVVFVHPQSVGGVMIELCQVGV